MRSRNSYAAIPMLAALALSYLLTPPLASLAGPRDGGGDEFINNRMTALDGEIRAMKPELRRLLNWVRQTFRAKANDPATAHRPSPEALAFLDRIFNDGSLERELATSEFVPSRSDRCPGNEDLVLTEQTREPAEVVAFTEYFRPGTDVCWRLRRMAELNLDKFERMTSAIHDLTHHIRPPGARGLNDAEAQRLSEELAHDIQDFIRSAYAPARGTLPIEAEIADHDRELGSVKLQLERAELKSRRLDQAAADLRYASGLTGLVSLVGLVTKYRWGAVPGVAAAVMMRRQASQLHEKRLRNDADQVGRLESKASDLRREIGEAVREAVEARPQTTQADAAR